MDILNWLNAIFGSQGLPIVFLLGGLLVFIYVMIGPTLWWDWQERRQFESLSANTFREVIRLYSNQPQPTSEEIRALLLKLSDDYAGRLDWKAGTRAVVGELIRRQRTEEALSILRVLASEEQKAAV